MRRSRSPKRGRSGILLRYERKGGVIVAFDVSGHAGFADAGRDIVCAAVSALVLTTSEGLRRHCSQRLEVEDTPEHYAVRLKGAVSREARAVVESMLTGLKAIAKTYPGYIAVRATRVSAQGPASAERNRVVPHRQQEHV